MTGSTLTDYNHDDIPDEDMDGDGEWDGLLGYGTYPITLQFFAFADHDRMPIRKVAVNFGDGSNMVGGQYGYYKNAKPYCDITAGTVRECGDTQLTCTTNQDCVIAGLPTGTTCDTKPVNFGNQLRACTQNYFEYNYIYSCYGTGSGANKVRVDSLPTAIKERVLRYPNITETDHICAYKPKVQVTDNWGWCNATDFGVNSGLHGSDCATEPNAWTSFGSNNPNDNLRVYVVPRVDR